MAGDLYTFMAHGYKPLHPGPNSERYRKAGLEPFVFESQVNGLTLHLYHESDMKAVDDSQSVQIETNVFERID